MNFIQPHLDAGEKALLAELPKEVLAAVVRAKSDEAVSEGIEATTKRHEAAALRDVVTPPSFLDSNEREGFIARSITSGQRVASGSPCPPLRAAMPKLFSRYGARAQEATIEVSKLREKVQPMKAGLGIMAERRDIALAKMEDPEELKSQERRWARRALAAVLAEVPVVTVTMASFFGITTIRHVSAGIWLSFATSVITGVAGSYALAAGAAAAIWRGRHLWTKDAVVKVAALAILVLGFIFVAALAGLRSAATQMSTHYSAAADQLGSTALLALAAITTTAVMGIVVAAHLVIADLKERRKESEQAHKAFDKPIGDLKSEVGRLETEAAQLVSVSQKVDELDSAYEAAVHAVARKVLDLKTLYAEWLVKGRMAWLLLSRLSPAQQEHIISDLYVLLSMEAKSTAAESASVPAKRHALFALLPLLFSFVSGQACTSPEPAKNLAVICDPTGKEPIAVCTSEFLTDTYDTWVEDAIDIPGSTLTVIMTGDTFGTTVIHRPLIVPTAFEGNPLAARERWMRESRAFIKSIKVVSDADCKSNANRSDLISALIIAAGLVHQHAPQVDAQIIVASDGLVLSAVGPYNFERLIPTAKDAVKRLKGLAAPFDLSGIDVVLCGQHTVGMTTATYAARARFWLEFLRGLGARAIKTHPNCSYLVRTAEASPSTADETIATNGDEGVR